MRRRRLIYEARNVPGAVPRVIAEMTIADDVTDTELTYALRQGPLRHEPVVEPTPPPNETLRTTALPPDVPKPKKRRKAKNK